MQDSENRRRIADRSMDNVPKMKYLLRPRQEENALGERRLASRDGNRMLELGVTCPAQSAERDKPATEADGVEAQKRNLERALAVDENHPEQGGEDRNVRNGLRIRQIENRFHAGAECQLLLGE